MSPAPNPLPENAGLAYAGEPAWPAARLTTREARQLAVAANPCGRPNADVLRECLGVEAGSPVRHWQVDYPAHFIAQEAALYEQPFARLRGVWQNPHANPELRRAVARVTRFLALPADAAAPDWHWIEEEILPDASLVVVARDDDFIHGLLASRAFGLWFAAHRARTAIPAIVEAFPFPWPPATLLGALTAAQEESRHAIARAIRAGNLEALNEAVARAYGWATDLPDDELLAALVALHETRVRSQAPSS